MRTKIYNGISGVLKIIGAVIIGLVFGNIGVYDKWKNLMRI